MCIEFQCLSKEPSLCVYTTSIFVEHTDLLPMLRYVDCTESQRFNTKCLIDFEVNVSILARMSQPVCITIVQKAHTLAFQSMYMWRY
jgi:hypothetical protein